MFIRSLERFLRLMLLALLVFVVLWRGGKGIEATWLFVFVGDALVIASLWLDGRSERSDVPRWLWMLVMSFVLWTVLSFLFSSTANYGLDEVLRDATLALLFFWTVREMGTDAGQRFFRTALRVLITLALVACAIGVFVYVLQPVNRFVGSFFFFKFSTDYWPNAWAEFVLLAWPLLFLWVRRGTSFRETHVRELLLGFALSCLLLSYSRGAVLAFAAQCALLVLLMRRDDGRMLPRGVRTLAVLAVSALLFFFAVNAVRGHFHAVESVTKKITFTSDEGASSFTERAQFFRQAVTLTMQRPFLGWGPYSFRFLQPRFEQSVLATSDHPHNVFLKLAAERGIPAALLFACIVVGVAWTALRRIRRPDAPAHLVPVLVAAAGVLVHNLIDYNLQFVGIVLPLWMLLGVLAAPGARVVDRRSRRMMHAVETGLACILLLVALSEGRFLVLSSLGRHAEAAKDTPAALTWYRRSEGEVFSRDLRLSEASLLLSSGALLDAERDTYAYLERNAEDARAWRILGEIRVRQFHFPDAVVAYRKAYDLGRENDISITRDYLQALAYGDDAKDIEASRPAVMAVLRQYGDAIMQNTHFIALSQNVENFAGLSQLASRLYPGDAEAVLARNTAVQEQAAAVRKEFSGRAMGYLW